MLDNLFDNYYFQNIFYSVIIISIAIAVIDGMGKKNIKIKDKISLKNIDYLFLTKLMCLSFAIRIFFEQVQINLHIPQTEEPINATILGIITFFIVRCIIAPIAEEIIFRYGLYEFLSTKFKGIFCVVLTSIIFACVHGYLLYDTFLLMLLSVFWTYSYYKKGNLFYPIILHFSHNLYALIGYAGISNIYYIFFGLINFVIFIMLFVKKRR